jgi:hypothetical protein
MTLMLLLRYSKRKTSVVAASACLQARPSSPSSKLKECQIFFKKLKKVKRERKLQD